MFGDLGHGAVLLLAGIVLCMMNSTLKAKYPGIEGILQARYILLLMGFNATFCGLVYNDFMSMPVYFWNTCYNSEFKLLPDCVYPFGIDPSWYIAHNELTFFNSLKMKLSVILGVAHMSLGIFLKGANACYQKDFLTFFNEFIPQILLMLSLFGYMDFMIIKKWLTDYSGHEGEAPGIITTMIDFALNGGAIRGRPFIGTVE